MRGLLDLGIIYLFSYLLTKKKKALRGVGNLLATEVKERFLESEVVTPVQIPMFQGDAWVKAAGK